ncbi:MAG: PHP domain-containing protein [Desulfitobacterium hafniense]|nr:PHP domain-containing protein [Desulfitobacterium hafniense]
MIDLHVHTKITDNSLTAGEVIKLAKEKGITHLAITDHDTTKGLREAIDIGNTLGVSIIPGIEISAYDYKRKKRAHILGLSIEPDHPALEHLCAKLVESRNQASFEMVRRLISAGYHITWDEVQKYAEGGTGVFKQHIMHALLDKGYCKSIYCDLYKNLFRRGSSPETQGLAYIPLEYIDAEAAIRAVREAGGVAVLAHPGQLNNYDAIDEWAELGLEGIEVFHPSHSKEDILTSLQYAQKHNLIITGGSDFHGFYGEIPVELGCQELDARCIQELLRRKQNRHSLTGNSQL